MDIDQYSFPSTLLLKGKKTSLHQRGKIKKMHNRYSKDPYILRIERGSSLKPIFRVEEEWTTVNIQIQSRAEYKRSKINY